MCLKLLYKTGRGHCFRIILAVWFCTTGITNPPLPTILLLPSSSSSHSLIQVWKWSGASDCSGRRKSWGPKLSLTTEPIHFQSSCSCIRESTIQDIFQWNDWLLGTTYYWARKMRLHLSINQSHTRTPHTLTYASTSSNSGEIWTAACL